MVVADGMGGHYYGEIAAQIAVQVLVESFQREATPEISDPFLFLQKSMNNAHRAIIDFTDAHNLKDSPRTTCVACICLLYTSEPVVAAVKPASIPGIPTPETAVLPKTVPAHAASPDRRRLALLFGNNDYKPPIPGLETPITDVEKIAAILRSHFGYDARVIKNASKAQIIEALNLSLIHI